MKLYITNLKSNEIKVVHYFGNLSLHNRDKLRNVLKDSFELFWKNPVNVIFADEKKDNNDI